MGVSLGGIGSIVGAGSALAGLFGGGSNQPPPPPPTYQLQNQAGADAGAYGGIGNLSQYNTAAQALPYAQQAFQNTFNNPYAAQYQQGANSVAQQGWGVGNQQIGAGQSLLSSGQALLPYQQQILQTGFDPMHEIYNTQQQQNTDQSRAALAARGLVNSPYGAGVENQSNIGFNQAWQNNLLNRQNIAAQGAGYLGNSAANQINLGQNVSTLGLNTLGQAAALPYSTANTIGNNQFNAVNQYGQAGANAAQIPQQQIQDYLQYLGIGNQAAGIQNQSYANSLTANNQQFNQGQTLGKNLGSSLSGVGSFFNNIGFKPFG